MFNPKGFIWKNISIRKFKSDNLQGQRRFLWLLGTQGILKRLLEG